MSAAARGPATPDADDIPLGTEIGRYRIVDRLGEGGMGQVFLATDTQLRRKVALKCLIPNTAGDEDLHSRILQEARAAVRVNHPNVATVHDIIEDENRTFIVLEYVEGETLEAALRRGRTPLERVLRVGGQLASALSAAHVKGVVHRDLKPANIQVMPDGSVKVLDFGIAKALVTLATVTLGRPAPAAPASRGQTGTPGYMSPEQMHGQEVDERSDIFNLGLILFELATGQRPPVESFLDPARAVPRADALDPQVPTPLADVIARALAVDVRRRFQTAADVGTALEGLEHSTRRVAPGPPPVRAASTSGTLALTGLRALGVAAGILALLTLLGAVSTATFNLTLGRTGPFAAEPLYAYPVWGLRSIVPGLVYVSLVVIVIWALGFLTHLAGLFEPIGRPLRASRATLRAASLRVGLNDPAVLTKALVAGGLLALAAVGVAFSDILAASMTRVSVAAPDDLVALAPDNELRQVLFGVCLDVLVLALGVGMLRVVRLRARLGIDRDRGSLVAGWAVVLLAVVMYQLPYRIVWQSEFERIQYAGVRCYILGEHAGEWLTHCPDAVAPRNRVVDVRDENVERSGVRESLFTHERLR